MNKTACFESILYQPKSSVEALRMAGSPRPLLVNAYTCNTIEVLIKKYYTFLEYDWFNRPSIFFLLLASYHVIKQTVIGQTDKPITIKTALLMKQSQTLL